MIGYAWFGLALLVVNQILLPYQLWFPATYYTPIQWTGYILFLDGLILRKKGRSLIHDGGTEILWMGLVSVVTWAVFEIYNLSLRNWVYFGLPENRIARDIGYVWSFATITPGLYQTADWLGTFTVFQKSSPPSRPFRENSYRISFWTGLLFLIFPPLLPAAVRPWTFAFIWAGFIFLLDPVNTWWGIGSFSKKWESGDRSFVYRWLLAGLVCGLLWEFWNYWAIGKWRYVGVPVLPQFKLFEMPVVGYLGFPPFALEMWLMWEFCKRIFGISASSAA